MDLPFLRYSHLDGRKTSEFVERFGTEARYVVLPDGRCFWQDRQGLILEKIDSCHGKEEKRNSKENQSRGVGVQSRKAAQRQTGPRQRANRKKP